MFSPTKLLVTVLIIAVALIALKLIGRRAIGKAARRAPVPRREREGRAAVELEPCRVCGAYVAQDGTPCERTDCPLARR